MRKVAHCPKCGHRLHATAEKIYVTYFTGDIVLNDETGEADFDYTGDSKEHWDSSEQLTYEKDGKKYHIFECRICLQDVLFHDIKWEEVE